MVLSFYKNIIGTPIFGLYVNRLAMGTLILTYCASVLVVMLECRPLSLYWTVLEDPGMSELASA